MQSEKKKIGGERGKKKEKKREKPQHNCEMINELGSGLQVTEVGEL